MANPRYSNVAPTRGTDGKPSRRSGSGGDDSVPMKTADWPEPKGGGQRNRSLGVKKLKTRPVEKGL